MSAQALTVAKSKKFKFIHPMLLVASIVKNSQESKRWKGRNDVHVTLPFLEGIGVDFRIVGGGHGIGNRVFVKLVDGVVNRLTKLGFGVTEKRIANWGILYWEKYAIAVELVPEENWESLCKALLINEIEYPSLEKIYEIIEGN